MAGINSSLLEDGIDASLNGTDADSPGSGNATNYIL
jgi:hypothetical protein